MAGFNFGGIFGGAKNTEVSGCGIAPAFVFHLAESDFITADLELTYSKILTDTFERIHGLPDELEPLLWDSCVQSEAARGLVTLLACAMTQASDLFLVYNKGVKVIRMATTTEAVQIRADYEKSAKSDKGFYISFRKFHITPMLRIYSALEHAQLASLYKTTNLSKAVQYKMAKMRASVSLMDSAPALDQVREMAKALEKGQDIALDSEDKIETAQPNLEATKNAIAFLQAKRAYILNAPISYITGEQATGLGSSSGEADMRAVERCLRGFFASVAYPICLAIFGVETEFRSQDFRDVTSGLEVLKTFDITTDENMSQETKQDIVARFFDLDPEKEKARIVAEQAKAPKPTPPVAPAPIQATGGQPVA